MSQASPWRNAEEIAAAKQRAEAARERRQICAVALEAALEAFLGDHPREK